jgi:hypothetical protein
MVDEQAFRSALADLDKPECAFAKALLGSHAACGRARRYYLADREGVECVDAVARMNCTSCLEAVRAAAAPELGATDGGGPLPHGVALRLQVGGLRGLAAALGDGVDDVGALVTAAVAREGGFGGLPMAEIVAAVLAFAPRRRR